MPNTILPTEPMIFDDLTPVEVPVTVGAKQYVLREANGDAAVKYRNAMLACTQISQDSKAVSIRGMADLEPFLVSLCLFDAQGKSVTKNEILSWPSRVQKALFARAKTISGLNEEDTVESLKKEQKIIEEKLVKLEKKEGQDPNAQDSTMTGSS